MRSTNLVSRACAGLVRRDTSSESCGGMPGAAVGRGSCWEPNSRWKIHRLSRSRTPRHWVLFLVLSASLIRTAGETNECHWRSKSNTKTFTVLILQKRYNREVESRLSKRLYDKKQIFEYRDSDPIKKSQFLHSTDCIPFPRSVIACSCGSARGIKELRVGATSVGD